MDELAPLARETLSETAYTTLCAALMQGRFKPGERLKIRELAAQLQTSVTPVRDAILRLAQDGALVFRSARDIRIPRVAGRRFMEIRAIRLRLEGLAAEEAAKHATAADIAGLAALLARHEAAMRAGDWLDGMRANQAFHFRLAEIGCMAVLRDVLQKLWLQVGPLIAEAYIDSGRAMIDHHYPVLEAVRAHDPAAAAKAIQDDIIQGGAGILAHALACAEEE
jgi:DNA-binding GntR family transcriptional regulator